MINHTDCDHERSSKARAKCRRQQDPDAKPTRKRMGATPKDSRDDDDRYGQTPRDRHMECDNCGVEKIEYRGTDALTGILRYVGERCLYTIKHAPDLTPLD